MNRFRNNNAGWCFVITCIFCLPAFFLHAQTVQTGAEVLLQHHLEELQEKRVGLVMNPTARIGEMHMLDTLLSRNVNITALFAPEHGFRGNYGAGEIISDGFDEATGLPVFSLYGRTRSPTQAMLEKVDVLLFDMQDVGARFYTYISTLGLVMEAAAQAGVSVWVLDRPNPAGGNYISGWILENQHTSFVGMYPIPVAHGLTMGEMAAMIKGEHWREGLENLDLRIVPMKNWQRAMTWEQTGLPWIPPSPNLPTPFHAWIYLGTCFIEGTNLSEGRGTEHPFLLLGSPTLHADSVLSYPWLDIYELGLEWAQFSPKSLPGVAPNPKHRDQHVSGIRILSHPNPSDPVAAGLELLRILLRYDANGETNSFLYLLTGTKNVDAFLNDPGFGNAGSLWEDDISRFTEQRRPYLLYE